MAWYKDPETGKITKVDLFEKNTDGLPSMKSVQAKIMCVPFNVPFRFEKLGQVTADGGKESTTILARRKGFNTFQNNLSPNIIGDTEMYWPYLPWNIRDSGASNSPLGTTLNTIALWGHYGDKMAEVNNKTKWPNAMQLHEFTNPKFAETTDLLRALCHFSYLKESSPYPYHEYVQYNYTTFELAAPSWHGYEKNNQIKSKTFPYAQEHSQYKNRLHLFQNDITLVGSSYYGQVGEDKHNEFIQILYDEGVILAGEKALGIPSWFINYPNRSYRDSTFVINKPFLEKAYESSLGEKTGLTDPVKVQAHYNFYLLPYEHAISDYHPNKKTLKVLYGSHKSAPIPEQLLPNMYALIYDQISEEPSYRYSDQGSFVPMDRWKRLGTTKLNFTKNDDFPDWGYVNTWNKQKFLKTLDPYLAITNKKQNINSTPTKNIGEYLNSFVTFLSDTVNHKTMWAAAGMFKDEPWWNIGNGGIKGPIELIGEKKYNVVGLSAYKMKEFTDEADKLKKMFPFHVDIELPMANSGFVGQTLFESGLTDIFMQNVMAASWTVYNSYENYASNYPTKGDMQGFYSTLKVHAPTSLHKTCLIRKDAFYKNIITSGDQQDATINPEQHTMFNETILKLWLNNFLESDILLDLDSAPAKAGGKTPIAYWFDGLPPQYYDWINAKSAPEHIKQIMTLKGAKDGKSILSTPFGEDTLNILKPVVFGKAPPKSSNNIKSLISWLAAKTKINKFINDRTRSVRDIYAGEKAYSEVLFYEVVKYKADDAVLGGKGFQSTNSKSNNYPTEVIAGYNPGTQGALESQKADPWYTVAPDSGPATPNDSQSYIQSFFIPNVPSMNVAKYIDTQIKFDKGYYYQVYAHTLVVGTQYENINGEWNGKTSAGPEQKGAGEYDPLAIVTGKYTLRYTYKPMVHLMRVPYYNTIATADGTVKLEEKQQDEGNVSEGFWNDNKAYYLNNLETTLAWDSPPIFPDAVFLPLYGEKNKVLLNGSFNIGEYDLEPISLESFGAETAYKEEKNIIKSRINQRKMRGPITYSGDDFCGAIEVFRIENKPTSYQDFSPLNKSRIATLGAGKSNFGFIDDTIVPNKDYYYIVREIDVHGNYSNPSPIYLARIVYKDGEAPYTVFKMFFIDELKKEKPKSFKKFMKYIKIKPNLNQAYLHDQSAEYDYYDYINNSQLLNEMVGSSELKQPIFGQKFKFRFTSKKTGRKFDLNLTVKDIAQLEKENKSTAGEPDTYSSGKC